MTAIIALLAGGVGKLLLPVLAGLGVLAGAWFSGRSSKSADYQKAIATAAEDRALVDDSMAKKQHADLVREADKWSRPE